MVLDDAEPRAVAALYGDGSDPARTHRLESDRLLTWVTLGPPVAGERAAWARTSARAHAEWPLVEAVVRMVLREDRIAQARVVLGGVANTPIRAPGVEAALVGQPLTHEVLDSAAARASEGASPLPSTAYKVGLLAPTVLDALHRAMDMPGAEVPDLRPHSEAP